MSKKNLSMTALKAIHRLAPGRKKDFEIIKPKTKFVARDEEEFEFLLKENAAVADEAQESSKKKAKRGRKKAEAPAEEADAEASAEEADAGQDEVL